MDIKEVYEREKHAVIHGQSRRFRIYKYIILTILFASVYAWKGPQMTLRVFWLLLIAALIMHFFYRWMTKGWRKSWGGYRAD